VAQPGQPGTAPAYLAGVAPTAFASAATPRPGLAPAPTAALAAGSTGQVPELEAEPEPISAPAATAPEAFSMRPGAIGAKAETFAIVERLRSSGLALDFITPELYAAARTYGFNGADAARAAHLAEAGYPVLAALAASADLALIAQGPGAAEWSPGATSAPDRPARRFVAPEMSFPTLPEPPRAAGPAARGAEPRRTDGARAAQAPDLAPLVPGASPRGAFLLPRVARELLSARPAPDAPPASIQPLELAALDVMAAGVVAGTDTAPEAPVRAARAALGDDLVLAAPWLGEGRELPPSVRAARAMAIAASGGAPGRVAFQLGSFVAPGAAGSAAPTTDVAPREAGWALQSLVAPPPVAPAPVIAPTHAVSSSFTGRQPAPPVFVTPATAASASSATSAAAQQPASHRPSGYALPQTAPELIRTGSDTRGAPASSGDFQIPDWFEAAARRMLAEKSGADDRMGLPELTLIGAAATSATTRLAADTGDQAAPAPPSSLAQAPGGGGSEGDDEDLEDMAREIWDEICRLQDVAKLRSGE
jgi:hypothetical protein